MMRALLAALFGLWASAASADLLTGVLQQQAQQTPTGGGGIAYESTGTLRSVDEGFTADPENVAMPSGLAAGNLLIAVTAAGPSTGITTAQSGWTRDYVHSDTYWGRSVSIFSHPVTTPGSEPSTIAFNDASSSRPFNGVILRFSNGTSIDAVSCTGSEGTQLTTHTTPNVTPTESSGVILSVVSLKQGGAVTMTVPAEVVLNDPAASGSDYAMGISVAASSGTSAQGSVDMTSTAAVSNINCSIALH